MLSRIFALLSLVMLTPFVQAMAVSAGSLITLPDFPSQNIEPRPVHVWLPDGYPSGGPYEVLYMHDGQMLFDDKTSWNKQEWGVDEVASKLMAAEQVRPFIVVGIENITAKRHAEYFPQKAWGLMPAEARAQKHPLNNTELLADNYLKFIVEELKPYIDENYSVMGKRSSTHIAGSSMGGLISLYALMEYPEVFASAAAVSTHWPGINPGDPLPVAESIRDYLRVNLPKPGSHRIYFDHGTETLDAHYPEHQKKVDAIMREKGYSDARWTTRVFTGHAHDERSWQSRLTIPLLFLFATDAP
ncbi:hypothetical protein Mag101_13550 [Microbulbifer agarilyticus]|uniref:Esterase n=1 Tax=Microbulbifer agarilyticus TaxID=260552 RepID=A0A1Q2M789_9GAMM|nr:alpha/beta hydrolase-fold protein [Microbulbifer agarilyticus]AQQ68541.1 hypothetical protein Mag101_13550 [Microbulbifer agarilyticus]